MLDKLGYSYDLKVVPASSFGVPQKRERLILMASKTGELKIPRPTHGTSRRPVSTVRDWIGRLPVLRAGATDPKDPDHRAMALSAINLTRIAATPEGGGRDRWKRPLMGKIASEHCDEIFLTNEDPYDEDPRKIVEEMAKGMTLKQPQIILDRREAIRTALKAARPGDAVLITGKGTDPYIMGSKNSKLPWSDVRVAREELETLLREQA